MEYRPARSFVGTHGLSSYDSFTMERRSSTNDSADLFQRLGKRCRDARLAKRMTQETLAESSGLSSRVIQKLEAGGTVGLLTASKVARALRLPLSEMVRGL